MRAIFYCWLITIMFQSNKLNAQKVTIYKDRVFGTVQGEYGLSIIKQEPYGIIIGTLTDAGIEGDKSEANCDTSFNPVYDAWIIKTDTSFIKTWDHSLGGSRIDDGALVVNDRYGKILLACRSNSDSSCEKTSNTREYPIANDYDYWISQFDSNGTILWDKTYGGIGMEAGCHIIRLDNGEIIVGGVSSADSIGGDKTMVNYACSSDYWVLKLDSSGNKLWDKVLGGAGLEQSTDRNDYQYSILPLSHGAFIMAGTTNSPPSPDITDTCKGNHDFWIIKMDSSGNKTWDHRYGGNRNERLGRIIQSPDNEFIIVGTTYSDQGLDVSDTSLSGTNSDLWIVKLDSNGVKQWDRRFGGNSLDNGYWIENAPGGGYWISGSIHSDSSSTVSEHPYGNLDYWMLKIDSAGNKIFDKRFGGPGNNETPRFVILSDSSIILCGCADTGTTSIKTQPGYGKRDIWCIHFKYEDTLSTSGVINHSSSGMFASVHPNPANQFFNVKWSLPSTENILFYLYDATGRIVLTRNSIPEEKEMNISTQDVPSGLYFWKVSCKNRSDQNGKMVMMK